MAPKRLSVRGDIKEHPCSSQAVQTLGSQVPTVTEEVITGQELDDGGAKIGRNKISSYVTLNGAS